MTLFWWIRFKFRCSSSWVRCRQHLTCWHVPWRCRHMQLENPCGQRSCRWMVRWLQRSCCLPSMSTQLMLSLNCWLEYRNRHLHNISCYHGNLCSIRVWVSFVSLWWGLELCRCLSWFPCPSMKEWFACHLRSLWCSLHLQNLLLLPYTLSHFHLSFVQVLFHLCTFFHSVSSC